MLIKSLISRTTGVCVLLSLSGEWAGKEGKVGGGKQAGEAFEDTKLSQSSLLLVLGSQLKPASCQCCLLAYKHPQQCTVGPEKLSLGWVFA